MLEIESKSRFLGLHDDRVVSVWRESDDRPNQLSLFAVNSADRNCDAVGRVLHKVLRGQHIEENVLHCESGNPLDIGNGPRDHLIVQQERKDREHRPQKERRQQK